MPTNGTVITVITTTLAFCGMLCVLSICLLSYWAIQIPPELNTLTGGLVGALTAMLVKTSPTETTKAAGSEPTPPDPDAPAMPVTVENSPNNPVPTTETH